MQADTDDINYIFTEAPFSSEDIGSFFTDENCVFVVDYEESQLKGNDFVAYLKNIDMPCHVYLYHQESTEELLKAYMETPLLVRLPEVIETVAHVLLASRGLEHGLMFDPQPFIENNKELVDLWVQRLKSFSLFSIWSTKQKALVEWVESHPTDESLDTMVGCNIVHLFDHDVFSELMETVDVEDAFYLPTWFNEPQFMGETLFNFWLKSDSPWLKIPFLAVSEEIDLNEFAKDLEEIINES